MDEIRAYQEAIDEETGFAASERISEARDLASGDARCEEAALAEAIKAQKEDPYDAIFRTRCLVANYLGVAPETLGPIRREDERPKI